MSAIEVGRRLVALVNAGKDAEAVEELYDEKIVSIEGQDMAGMSARMEGLDAVRSKHAWWESNHEVHESVATGPFVGHRDDRFVVHFVSEVTTKATGERTRMREVGLFTVNGDRIVQEEFLYLMA